MTRDPQPGQAKAHAEPHVVLAHSGRVIAGAARCILSAQGFRVSIAEDADAVRAALAPGPEASVDALVIDVAMPDGFEMVTPARVAGVRCVILVASVFRRTSYKRRPRRLYGADDYVEIHHLGDHLPQRLRKHLGMGELYAQQEGFQAVLEGLRDRADDRLGRQTPEGLAALIVADLLLYNGDHVSDADSVDEAYAAVAGDLAEARELFAGIDPEAASSDRDLIGESFRRLVRGLELPIGVEVERESPT